ncbi:hypothetical protein [Gracilibacillus massiliensis]|uniref:hypothetical protein n=1 Tax=Gracilibacillus massiliensis TaxID=1564956 RepID=UPI00071C4E64|nr:hypothetical protein [Gracilibacillus massiliensis]
MRILLCEIRKAIVSPVILTLLILFIVFNFFQMYENAYIKEDLREVNRMAESYGTVINDEMVSLMENDYKFQMEKVNGITSKVLSKTYQDMNEFYLDNSFYTEDAFTEKELELFSNTVLLEMYYFTSFHVDESFYEIDPVKIAEAEIKKYGIRGSAAELIRSQYDKFNERYSDVLKNKEYKHLFPAQSLFATHLLLFKTMFKSFLFESLILTVLVTAYVMNFEFDRRTHLLTYSSRRGRKLWVDKLWASLITNVGMLTLLLGIGLSAYFSVFSYQSFWNVPISSYFNAGNWWFMSWWNLSFLEYLIAAIVLAYLLIILFTLMTVILARWIHNSYLVFFLFLCLFGVIIALQGLIPSDNIAFVLGFFTPVHLVLNSFLWFMYNPLTFTAYFEVITVTVWFVILLLATAFCERSFRKCDLK